MTLHHHDFDPPAAGAVTAETAYGDGDFGESAAGPRGVGEATQLFVGDWMPRFAAALRRVHPEHTAKRVARALNATGLCNVTEHGVERWLGLKPSRPTGDAVFACIDAFGVLWLLDVLGPEHPISRALAVRLNTEALGRMLQEMIDRRVTELLAGLVPGDRP